MKMSVFIFSLMLCSMALLVHAQGNNKTVYYIKANEDDLCPTENCYTLTQFSQMLPFTTRANVTFMSGVHSLNNQWLLRRSLDITLTGVMNSTGTCDIETAPTIQCELLADTIQILTATMAIHCLNFYNCHVYSRRASNADIHTIRLYESYYESIEEATVNMDSVLVYNSGVNIERNHGRSTIARSTFLQNQPPIELPGLRPISSRARFHSSGTRSLHLYITSTVIIDCDFYNSQRSAINAQLSVLSFTGNSSFIGNTGYQGGAIFLQGSLMTLSTNARLTFENNHAGDVGGAIYSTEEVISQFLIDLVTPIPRRSITSDCAIRFTRRDFHMRFINNSAVNGGSAIHGVTFNNAVCRSVRLGNPIIDESSISFEPDDPSTVTANPQRVCFCAHGNLPNCSLYGTQTQPNSLLNFEIYPGQQISVDIIVVGFTYGTITSQVYAELRAPGPKSQLSSELEGTQVVEHTGCTRLHFTVLSNRSNETLILSPFTEVPNNTQPQQPENDRPYNETNAFLRLTQSVGKDLGFLASPMNISISYLLCPHGFELTEEQPRCECEPLLQQHGLDCNIETQTVTRSGNVWINASYFTNNQTIIHTHCPFGFCNSTTIAVNLQNPDSQCSHNRSGTLCGGCQQGLSIALGSSKCRKCSNSYLALFIPFILAGIVLVFFIKYLNLTVAQGTIGGLVFFANIVGSNQTIFFPQQGTVVSKILNTFIAWVNLDLGINTCFFDGLDAYGKTWLQFVFPFYIWSLTIFMIVAAHYSTQATKLFGNNSVPVLATLLLLSYAKLLRTIINILSFTIIEFPDGSKQVVWAFDGNVLYFSAKHAILVMAAMLMVILLWLPYTLRLVLGQWPKKLNNYKGFRWILNLNQFFDVYFRPFNDKHVHWVGILLVVRIVLFVIFAAFFAVENNVNLLMIFITSAILLTYTPALGHAYKRKSDTLLEGSFFINLIVLSGGTIYVRQTNGNQEALVCISVSVAFATFVAIVIYHSYRFVVLPKYKKQKRTTCRKKNQTQPTSVDTPNEEDLELCVQEDNQATHQEISFDGRKMQVISCTVVEIDKSNGEKPLSELVNESDTSIERRKGSKSDGEASPLPSNEVEITQIQISVPDYISKSD